MKFILKCILIAVILNLLLPYIFKPFALPIEIKPPFGAGKLSFKGQFMHMMVHHNQVPLSSSVIIALIVGTSVYLAKKSDILF